jgi:hypothetical protein
MGTNISGLGIANAIGFKPRVDGGRRFLPPNIKSSLVSVISTYGKKNTDSDRDILKDLTGKGNDFKLFNFSFSEASGYGEYKTDFNKNWTLEMAAITGNQIVTFNRGDYKAGVFFLKIPTSLKVNIASFTVDVDFKSSKEDAAPYYYYWDTTGKRNQIILVKGKNVLPVNYASNSAEGSTGSGFHDSFCDTVTIKQIPDFEGWLCTDGVNDIIESVKPISEMLEGSNEITVVSIIHQISQIPGSEVNKGLNNQICYYDSPTTRGYLRNSVKDIGKTGIYGYTFNGTAHSVINNILGDKNDYIAVRNNEGIALNGVFSVCGYKNYYGELKELSSIAYAGGFIANKVLTTDEINQVIAYYNLDRPGEIIKPSMLYDIRKQGITNINHAEFNDELIDYINGYNIKMYNMLWDKQSGIGNYPISFKDYTYLPARGTVEINRDSFVITSNTSTGNLLEVNTKTKVLPAYKVKIEGTSTIKEGNLKWRITTTAAVTTYIDIFEDGIYDIPAAPQTEEAAYSGWCISKYNETVNVKVTLLAIDDITDAIVLNGIDNFGKVIDVPIWKDYTICALRKWLYTASVDNGIGVGSLVSKSKVGQDGAFIVEQSFLLNPNKTAGYNFGAGNSSLLNDKINEKSFAIQTKYTYGINRQTLSVGSGLDTNTLWFGTVRNNDTRFSYLALWNLMLFPYTMSNFILERQLKKYKLGSLYPDNSFPFRPVVTANSSTKSIQYFDVVTGKSLAVGNYVAKEQQIQLNIMLNDIDEVIKVTIDGKEVPLYNYNEYYRYRFNIHNSYPKIDITIQEYVKYDDIVQPYPVIFVLQDKESGKELTYGNYVKVGDIIKVKSVIYYNQDLWSIHGYQIGDDSKIYSYNELINKDIVVTKPLSFGCIKKWLLSTAEPLFVYDPAIFTNNAIKTLGYLPDISGQNRHLKLYNFSYEGMSGVNGYPVVFGKNKTWIILRSNSDNANYEVTPNIIKIYKSDNNSALLYSPVYNDGVIRKISVPSFKLKVTGLKKGQTLGYKYVSESDRNLVSAMAIIRDGIYDIPQSYPIEPDESTPNGSWIGFITNTKGDYDTTLEILSEYEGSLYFNGVNDYGTVQNLTYGGKCLVSKLNYNLKSSIIYDQRSTLDNTSDTNTFALYIGNNNNNVYSERLTGDVYINNVLNNYINNTDLNNNTHVVTAICSIVDSSNSEVPIFGRSKTSSTYAQFAMYRTILLPEVPNAADRAILNKWCGLPTGYLPKPEYYWDVTGKSNSDTATRNTIKNLGTAKPVASTSDEDAYSLENKNVAYEGMSGYNGYPVVFGANKTWETCAIYNFTGNINGNKLHITHIEHANNGFLFSYVKREGQILNKKEIPSFKIKISGLEGDSKLLYLYLKTENATGGSSLSVGNGVHELPKSFIPTESLQSNIWVGFTISSAQEGVSSFDCDITLEILPDYYGLCLDGITNYVECANVPAFTDYTYIIKYEDIGIPNLDSCVQHKGLVKQGGGAYIQNFVSKIDDTTNLDVQFSFGIKNSKTNNNMIQYCTKTNYNGITIVPGNNVDDLGITIGKWYFYRKMIFYKLMLWSKSINNTYHINMLRNLINNGGIIDLNDSIFDQTSNE